MYRIIINDYEKVLQLPANGDYFYLTDARDACIYLATEYILKFEGARYLNRLFYSPAEIRRRGYYLVKEDTALMTRVTVYYKEPNGLIYSGELRAVREYITCKTANRPVHGFAEFGKVHSSMEFDEVINELNAKFAEDC